MLLCYGLKNHNLHRYLEHLSTGEEASGKQEPNAVSLSPG